MRSAIALLAVQRIRYTVQLQLFQIHFGNWQGDECIVTHQCMVNNSKPNNSGRNGDTQVSLAFVSKSGVGQLGN